MGTTADKLELLLRTKERQKAYLQEKYPLLDFDTIPFRAYLDLFQGRSYVPGFVGGWKAYGRSNDEAADTRKYLYDYSGNGRDIELFNFAFAGMSGYGGYPQENYTFRANNSSTTTTTTTTTVNGILVSSYKTNGTIITARGILLYKGVSDWDVTKPVKVKAGDYGVVLFATGPSGVNSTVLLELGAGKTGEFTFGQDNIDAGRTLVMAGPAVQVSSGATFNFWFLPDYSGALVSDGIDDYGRCIKDFALPDDYTVVAIRKNIDKNDTCFINKSPIVGQGAFIFEMGTNRTYSYGQGTFVSIEPALFSYQTKTSYNGNPITPGSGVDSDSRMELFRLRYNSAAYAAIALYDLRIYDHSLTAEELQIVKDEMMSDYENATGGGIADITYVADWDGKGRSNDEEADVRSQWIDKATGKVINLSNYSFSEMSGWNGYTYDFLNFRGNYSYSEHTPTKIQVQSRNEGSSAKTIAEQYLKTDETIGTFTFPGLYLRISNPNDIPVNLDYYPISGTTINLHEGINYIPEKTIEITDEMAVKRSAIRFSIGSSYVGDFQNLGITLELLPLYPGALVSDGVDDRGISAEVINEEIKTVVMHLVGLAPTWVFFIEGADGDQTKRIGATYSKGKLSLAGIGNIENDGKPYGFNRNVPVPNNKLYIGCAIGNVEYGKSAIHRLIFIKEQLDAAQLEFLTWKVSKEYRDWCKENGYDYAIDEMLNN